MLRIEFMEFMLSYYEITYQDSIQLVMMTTLTLLLVCTKARVLPFLTYSLLDQLWLYYLIMDCGNLFLASVVFARWHLHDIGCGVDNILMCFSNIPYTYGYRAHWDSFFKFVDSLIDGGHGKCHYKVVLHKIVISSKEAKNKYL